MRKKQIDMKPDDLRVALLRAGVSQAKIARDNGVSPTMINRIVLGLSVSDRVQRAIASAIGIDVKRIWPSIYIDGGPRKPGRPKTY